MKKLLLLLLMLVCSVAQAEVKAVIQGPKKVKAGVPFFVSAKKSVDFERVEWMAPEGLYIMTFDDRDLVGTLTIDEPGTYIIGLTAYGKPVTYAGDKKDKNGFWTDGYVQWLESYFGKPVSNQSETTLEVEVTGGAPAVNPFPAPATTVRPLLEPLLKLKLSRADATNLATMYHNVSQANLATTEDLRTYTVKEGSSLGLAGKYAGLAKAVDDFWNTTIGLKIRPTEEKDLAAMRALAWAVWETGR
jgi:hypothetical protein